MTFGFLIAATASGVEPCYGWTFPTVVEGDRVSVEYDKAITNETIAQRILDATESAWTTYEGLGFLPPVGAPAFSLEADPLGRGGFAVTELCDGMHHAKLFVYEGSLNNKSGRPVAVHELFHAVQYAYDPQMPYVEHFARWPWWAEGTATWAEAQAQANPRSHLGALANHLELGHLALHQDVTALVDPQRSDFLYSTAMLAFTLEAREGARAIADTFNIAAQTPGERAWFPDVVEDLDIDFDALWADHLRRLPTVDHTFGSDLGVRPDPVSTIQEVPGTAGADPDRPPQGLGWAIHRLQPSNVAEGDPIEVSFTGASDARWHVVVVTANRIRAGASSTLAFDARTDGDAPITHTLNYQNPMWIVVSPEADDTDGFDYTVSLKATAEGPAEACGCTTGPSGTAFGLLLIVGVVVRRTPHRGAPHG
ncbi:MAG: hypothetical protein AAGA48_11625 [Myxococcota bacterium]